MSADCAAPATTLATANARLRQGLRRELLYMAVLCTAIALLLTAIFDRDFANNLVYSFAIGLCCWLITGVTRLVVVWVVDRARAARGEAGTDTAAALGWRGMIPLSLLAMLIGPPLGLWIGDALTGEQSTSLLRFESTTTRITLALSVLGTLTSVFILTTLERLASARAAADHAQRVAAESQLRLLQSQLEPHMLFNTLANLRVLIGIEPARAQAMLDHLIAFLRATLGASRTAVHPLATEFERLADYLALMAIRMGPRLQVALDLPDALRGLPVPPLVLQPLVENGIKHGLEPQVTGGRVVVGARRDADTLVLTVRDTGTGIVPDPGTSTSTDPGFGLAQVRERLATLYGARASLTLEPALDGGGGTLATIRLPLPAADK